MCGFLGLVGDSPAAPQLALALQTIQHRGQDAAGIGTYHDGRFALRKELGMVAHALPAAEVSQLPGKSGIAHVRYPTVGAGRREDAQPFVTRRPGILCAHNGNVTNIPQLAEELGNAGLQIQSTCDAEPILLVFSDELNKAGAAHPTSEDVVRAVGGVLKRVRGAYSVTCVLVIDGQETLIAFRDSHAIRPAVYGSRADGSWMVASESVALDVLGFETKGHIEAGTVMLFRHNQEPVVRPVDPKASHHCVFERIYFARPDSRMEDGRVNAVRWKFGTKLADEWKARGMQADVVIAVPDTSRPAAQAMAERLNLPNREGFIKNRYSGRTFIMPDATTRDAALRLKLNPIAEEFEGKRVILVDDSIVRGTTMRRILRMVWDLNPAEVHLAIFSPPVRHPCFYGIDMPQKSELVAATVEADGLEAALKARFRVDSVTYLSTKGLTEVGGSSMCTACFTGDYPVAISDEERRFIVQDRRPTPKAPSTNESEVR